MPIPITVEICVDSLTLARAAERGGTDRIELCGPLRGGGITPSAGLLQAARRSIQLPIAVLIRPRTGPFTATEDEFEVMQHDLLFAKNAGADIAVLGILHPNNTVDIARTSRLVALAYPMPVTFHRAFDACIDPQQALLDVIETGAIRILTSGGGASALQGAPAVNALREQAFGRIGFLLCGSLRARTAHAAIAISGVHQVHAALRDHRPTKANAQNLDSFSNAVAALKRAANQPAASPPSAIHML